MKIIKKLSLMIEEELEDAEKYAICANKYAEEYPDLSRVFYELANEELKHSEKLHASVVALINEYRMNNGEPPANMLAIYEYVHDRQIEQKKGIKVLLDIYRGA